MSCHIKLSLRSSISIRFGSYSWYYYWSLNSFEYYDPNILIDYLFVSLAHSVSQYYKKH